jgi:hypothetical protein
VDLGLRPDCRATDASSTLCLLAGNCVMTSTLVVVAVLIAPFMSAVSCVPENSASTLLEGKYDHVQTATLLPSRVVSQTHECPSAPSTRSSTIYVLIQSSRDVPTHILSRSSRI